MREEYDAIVVGAGPAGSSAAFFFSQQGKSVALLDKDHFPRPKACGDGVIGKSLPILEEMGVLESLREQSFLYRKISFFTPEKGRLILEMPTPCGPHFCAQRHVFDHELLKSAQKSMLQSGGNVFTGFKGVKPLYKNGRMIGVEGKYNKADAKLFAKVTIGAGGYNCPVAKSLEKREGLNLLWRTLSKKYKGKFHNEGENCVAYREYWENVEGCTENIEVHFLEGLEPGYFWIFPISETKANVGVGLPQSKIQGKQKKLKEIQHDIINSHPLLSKRFNKAKRIEPKGIGGVLPMATRDYRMLFADGALLTGDAASLVSPWSGEGICNALISGKLSARYADGSLEGGMAYQEELMKSLEKDLSVSLKLRSSMKAGVPLKEAIMEIYNDEIKT